MKTIQGEETNQGRKLYEEIRYSQDSKDQDNLQRSVKSTLVAIKGLKASSPVIRSNAKKSRQTAGCLTRL